MLMETFNKIDNFVDKLDLSTKFDIPSYIQKKDKAKATIADGFIGFGKIGSYTAYYKQQFLNQNMPINDNYLPNHAYFVGIDNSGHNIIPTYEECIKALENDAILITDSLKYLKGSNNEGEKQLRQLLLSYGAIPDEFHYYALWALTWEDE